MLIGRRLENLRVLCFYALILTAVTPACYAQNGWVWGARDSSDEGDAVGTTEPTTTRSAITLKPTEKQLQTDFEPFTDLPQQSQYVQGADKDGRQARIHRPEAYDQVYQDPQVIDALEAGNDTQARFFIRDKLCNLGLLSCEDDYLPPLPPPRLNSAAHYPGKLDNLLYVQPIKVAPHGPPVPAVPLGPTRPVRPYPHHHHSGLNSGSAYSGAVKSHYKLPKPAYAAPKPTYGAPKPTYGAPKPTYGAPKPTYGAPRPGYSPPKAVYPAAKQPHPINYNGAALSAIKAPHSSGHSYKQPAGQVSPTAVHTHVHHHTHYEQHTNGGGASGFGINRSGKEEQQLAAASSHTFRPDGAACVCVARYACAVEDVVNGREGRYDIDLSAISPRSRDRVNISAQLQPTHADIANKDDAPGNKDTEEHVAARNTGEDVEQDGDLAEDSSSVRHVRRRRQTLEQQVQQLNTVEDRQTVIDVQGRQLGYRPNSEGCLHTDVCCRKPVILNQQRRQSGGTCGQSYASAINGRISNYDAREGETYFGEFPWQAAILEKDGVDNVYICGATLISDQFLLTAAHCVDKYDRYSLRVRLGEWDVNSENEFYGHEERDVSGLYIHPQYQRVNLFNDIAILRLSSRLSLFQSAHIAPVCLPSTHEQFVGERCWASGWGKNAFGTGGNFQNVLKKVSLPVVSNSLCERQLRYTRLGRQFRLHDGFMCAGGEAGKDACKGDGGGPLVCSRGGNYHLAGVVSWGVGCGEKDVPGVYVKVTQYISWIRSITQGGGFPQGLGRGPSLARQLNAKHGVLVAEGRASNITAQP